MPVVPITAFAKHIVLKATFEILEMASSFLHSRRRIIVFKTNANPNHLLQKLNLFS